MKVSANRYCANSTVHRNVTTQIDCQELCEAVVGCPGISYSNKNEMTHLCYVCHDEILSVAGNDFGFYKRLVNATTGSTPFNSV